MTRTKRMLASLLTIVLIASAVGAQTASANWSEGFVIDVAKPATETEATPVDPAVEYAAEVLRLVNLEREAAGLVGLSGLEALKTAADTRAKEVSVVFAHKRLDGSSPRTVFTENKLNYSHVGENIAHGYTDAAALVKAWMNSTAHKNVILKAEYTHAELGYYKNSDGRTFNSMLFFTPAEGE